MRNASAVRRAAIARVTMKRAALFDRERRAFGAIIEKLRTAPFAGAAKFADEMRAELDALGIGGMQPEKEARRGG